MKIPPPQAAGFGYPQAGGVKQAEQEPVSWFGFGGEHSLHLLLAKDSFRQAILVAWQRQFRRRIDWQVPHPVAEGEQALNGGQRACSGDGSQTRTGQGLSEALQICQGYAGDGLFGVI